MEYERQFLGCQRDRGRSYKWDVRLDISRLRDRRLGIEYHGITYIRCLQTFLVMTAQRKSIHHAVFSVAFQLWVEDAPAGTIANMSHLIPAGRGSSGLWSGVRLMSAFNGTACMPQCCTPFLDKDQTRSKSRGLQPNCLPEPPMEHIYID